MEDTQLQVNKVNQLRLAKLKKNNYNTKQKIRKTKNKILVNSRL